LRVCYDLYFWYPSRSHALNHEKTQPVVGVTNRDYCLSVYWLIGETDHKRVSIEKLKSISYMVVETRKGYHIYTRVFDSNPLRLIHKALKEYRFLDKHHLRMGLHRYRRTREVSSAVLVLRVSPKYREPDLKIVFFDRSSPLWFHQVKSLIERLNSC